MQELKTTRSLKIASNDSKKNVIIKIFVKCDVYNKIKFVDNKHRLISSQKKNCKFIVIAKLTNNYKDSKTNKEQ